MPQISQLMETYGSQIFWILLIFGFIYFVIGRAMVPKVQSTMDLRDQRISGDLAAAKAARDEADRIEEAYRARQNADREAAQATVAAAKAKASAATEAKLAKAGEEIAAKVAAAEAEIAAQRTAALGEVQTVATEAVESIVARLTTAKFDRAAVAAAVKGAMPHG